MLRVTSKLQDRVQERWWIQSHQKKGSNQKLEWDRQQIADTAIAKWYLAISPGAIYLRGRSHLPRHPLSYSINSPNTGSLSSWVCFCYGISTGDDKTEANCFIAGVLRCKIPWTKGNQTLQQLTPNTTKPYSTHLIDMLGVLEGAVIDVVTFSSNKHDFISRNDRNTLISFHMSINVGMSRLATCTYQQF